MGEHSFALVAVTLKTVASIASGYAWDMVSLSVTVMYALMRRFSLDVCPYTAESSCFPAGVHTHGFNGPPDKYHRVPCFFPTSTPMV